MSGEELPEGWTVASVQELGEVRLGKQRSPKDHTGERMREYLRVANVFDSRLALSDVMSMNFTRDEEATFALRHGDILLNEGQSPHLLGRPAMYTEPDGRYAFTNSLIRFRAKSGVIPQFMLQQFRHMMFSGQFAAVAQITTNIAHLGKDRFASLKVPVPPTAEQTRVAARLDALQSRSRAAGEALAEVPALLGTFRQSVLAAAFRGDLTAEWRAKNPDVEPASKLLERIRGQRKTRWEKANPKKMYVEPEPVDDSEMAELPEGWSWVALEELAEVQLGQQRAPIHADAAVQVPYIRAANITWDGLDLTDVKTMGFENRDRYELRPGDILMSEASGSPMEVGKPAIWRGEIEGCCYQKTLLRARPDEKLTSSEWLYLCVLHDALSGRFAAMAPGVGIVHLTAVRMLRWPVPMAPLAEQAELVRLALDSVTKIRRMAGQLGVMGEEIAALDQSILARAFRGELVDQDPNDEPAEALLARIKGEPGTSGAVLKGRPRRSAGASR